MSVCGEDFTTGPPVMALWALIVRDEGACSLSLCLPSLRGSGPPWAQDRAHPRPADRPGQPLVTCFHISHNVQEFLGNETLLNVAPETQPYFGLTQSYLLFRNTTSVPPLSFLCCMHLTSSQELGPEDVKEKVAPTLEYAQDAVGTAVGAVAGYLRPRLCARPIPATRGDPGIDLSEDPPLGRIEPTAIPEGMCEGLRLKTMTEVA